MNAEFVRDETFQDGTHVQPGTRLTKKWTVRNIGTAPWASKTVVSPRSLTAPPLLSFFPLFFLSCFSFHFFSLSEPDDVFR